MKHFNYETLERLSRIFYKQPESFTKYTDKELLSYMLGATLYMPATRESIAKDVIDKKYKELTSMVIDLEDAVGDNQLQKAEDLLLIHLEEIYESMKSQKLLAEELPLIFIRVRNPEQLLRISEKLGVFNEVLTGYVFPKFTFNNGLQYMKIIEDLNKQGHVLYAMPILESTEYIFKEMRIDSLINTKALLDDYKQYVLNIRIGATDFCGLFGIRRKIDTTIYDVSVIRDCIADIINVFNRNNDGYVISAPVWEYFPKDQRIFKPKLRQTPFQYKFGSTGVQKRIELINDAIDGVINEVILDKLNGFIGKTIIHPTHIKLVNSLYTVTHEEYLDAVDILNNTEGNVGVLKSTYNNKMNEIKPHYYWAKRILLRAKAFGVFNANEDFISLIVEE